MIDNLKPCPFCGRPGELSEDLRHEGNKHEPIFYYVFCRWCELKTYPQNTQAEAVKTWNARPVVDEIVMRLNTAIEHSTVGISPESHIRLAMALLGLNNSNREAGRDDWTGLADDCNPNPTKQETEG